MYVQAKKEGLVVEEARWLAWMDGHVGKDGKVNISAVEKYEQVKAARAKRKELIDAGLQALYAIATAIMAAKTTPTSNAPRSDHMDEALLQKHTELINNVSFHLQVILYLLFPNDKHKFFCLFL
ncbi:hypothetical protein MKW92_048870 [Papaver armeniacum]|nr:hypothetical protein MKW92_048870 [Papaver armeniacum]